MTTPKPTTSPFLSRTLRFLVGAASFGIILLVLQYFAAFVNIVLVAAILGIVFTPLLVGLKRRGIPGWLALLLTMLVVVAIVVGLFVYLLFAFGQLNEAIPLYAAEMEGLLAQIDDMLLSVGGDPANAAWLLEVLDPFQIIDFVADLVRGLISVLSDAVVVLLVLAFLLVGQSNFLAKTERLIQGPTPGLSRLFQFNQDIRRYILITNNLGLLAGATNAIFLAIIGVDFALLWGVLSWLLSYIPMVGFFLAMIPPLILGLLEFGWPVAVLIAVGYVLINSAVDDVLKPRMMGKGLDLAPVVIFVSVVFWGLILGPLGGVLAVPVTLAVKQLILEPDPGTRWIADLLSGDEPVELVTTAVEEPETEHL